jgi:hypothetical protein
VVEHGGTAARRQGGKAARRQGGTAAAIVMNVEHRVALRNPRVGQGAQQVEGVRRGPLMGPRRVDGGVHARQVRGH